VDRQDAHRVKQKALNDHLPRDSTLRTYLAQKDETARTPLARRRPKLAPYRRIPNPKTLLVMPPMCLYEGAIKRVVPPLGLCYIAAALEQQGLDVTILDCIVEGVDEVECTGPGVWRFGMSDERFANFIREHDFDVVGLSMIYSSDLPHLYSCARIVKEVCPDTVVVAGGLHASIYTTRFLEDSVLHAPSIDFVLRGEGETRLPVLLQHLAEGTVDLHQDGLAGWRDGEIFVNPQLEQITELDGLPFPAYHKVPLEKYFAHNVPFSPYPRGKRVMQIYTSRGCPIGCTFCASTNFAKAHRVRSVENVIREIRFYQREYGIDEIQFADDNLTFDRGRSMELFSELAKLDLQWCTPNGIMINTLDKALLDRMIDSGLYQITLSVDSGHAETLRELHRKPVDLSRLPDLMWYLDERRVLMHGTLVVGMPGESEENIKAGFAFVESLPFHSMNVFIAQAIPGSELFEGQLSSGMITFEDALRIDTARSTLRLTTIPAERLEFLVADFLQRYNRKIRDRDPEAWERKYAEHTGRMRAISVGTPGPNTDTILRSGSTTRPALSRAAGP
jgi:anaerobic magnesium-protoporphyrin IX monomethyl ester cyclase